MIRRQFLKTGTAFACVAFPSSLMAGGEAPPKFGKPKTSQTPEKKDAPEKNCKALKKKLAELRRNLKRAERAEKKRERLFNSIRNDAEDYEAQVHVDQAKLRKARTNLKKAEKRTKLASRVYERARAAGNDTKTASAERALDDALEKEKGAEDHVENLEIDIWENNNRHASELRDLKDAQAKLNSARTWVSNYKSQIRKLTKEMKTAGC